MHSRTLLKSTIWGIFLTCALLSGCAGTPNKQAQTAELAKWISDAESHLQSLPENHPDAVNQIMSVSDEMRAEIIGKFGGLPRSHSVNKLARWLVDVEGHGMVYEVGANLTPIQAYGERRGNCLSFTILLSTLASELGMELRFNEVDLPDEWNLEDDERHLILYRHVNAIHKIGPTTHIFDLAIENYDKRYPQRVISQKKAIAMMHNNRAIDAFRRDDSDEAFHYLKLAVALAPNYSDLFANLGALFKRTGQHLLAEHSLLYAFELDAGSEIAASSLERFYRESGRVSKAERFAKKARFVRRNNPYYQYEIAKQNYQEKRYSTARKAIKRAKKLHGQDDRFFAMSSLIERQLGNYRKALKDLEKAHKLSTELDDRDRYFSQAKEVAQLLVEREQKRAERIQSGVDIEVIPPGGVIWR